VHILSSSFLSLYKRYNFQTIEADVVMTFVSADTDVALEQKVFLFNLSYAHVIGVTWGEGGKGSKNTLPPIIPRLNFFFC